MDILEVLCRAMSARLEGNIERAKTLEDLAFDAGCDTSTYGWHLIGTARRFIDYQESLEEAARLLELAELALQSSLDGRAEIFLQQGRIGLRQEGS